MLCLTTQSLSAQTVNKWVDQEGVTHYSDQQPHAGQVGLEEIGLPEVGISEFDSEEANLRILRHLRQLEKDRLAREQAAETGKQQRALDAVLEREPLVTEQRQKSNNRPKRGWRNEYKGPFPMPLEERQRRDLR